MLDLLVPALGDVAAVDVMLGGERRRIGARVGPGVDPEGRRDGAAPPARRRAGRSSEGSMAADRRPAGGSLTTS